jgi:WhiB family transcriptional regulator, redox-sensing transcriptional regulator
MLVPRGARGLTTRERTEEEIMLAVVFIGLVGWRRAAACRSIDPELFFPVSSSGGSDAQVERAKAVCRSCAVRRQCLQYALAANEAHGVWGGMAEDERRRVIRRARDLAAPPAASGESR